MGCYTDEYTEGLEAKIERLEAALKSGWAPYPQTNDHALYDVLVIGRVERFHDDGPCYAWAGDVRLGAFETDEAARKAVLDAFA